MLFNFQQSAGLLERGLREFLVSKFKGRRIGATVFRANLVNEGCGQCIIIRVCGEEEELAAMEDEVLRMTDGNGQYYWEYATDYKAEQRVNALVSQDFSITQSIHGAVCGQTSDPTYDNKSRAS